MGLVLKQEHLGRITCDAQCHKGAHEVFTYLMTSRLSQDCLERSFGIVRQASGANDHPTPAQFIIIVRCMGFYSLAKSPKDGNVSPGLLESLLTVEAALQQNEPEEDVEDNAAVPMDAAEVAADHVDYIEQRSDARLVHYIAGYVARKRILPLGCTLCRNACIVPRDSTTGELPSQATREWDLGGLLYASESLYNLVQLMESKLTHMFSTVRLHAKVVASLLRCVSSEVPEIGCAEHCEQLTKSVVRFFCVTRVHFFFEGSESGRK